MNRRNTPLIALGGGTAALLLMGGMALSSLSPADWLARALPNPFSLITRTLPAGPVVLEQVQRLQRLETVRYNGHAIVRGEKKGMLPTWLAGDSMLFVGRGEVVAGVDLARLREGDLKVEGQTVAVKLPEPEILHTRLDNLTSQVHERRAGIFTGPDRNLEGEVRLEAETQIRQAALESGVLRTADDNAREMLAGHLRSLGFREVRFL